MSKSFLNASRVSRLFQPRNDAPKNAIIDKSDKRSKSYKLMLDMGIIRRANTGMYTLLPLGLRVLEKLIGIVDEEMARIGGQKLLLPNLTRASLWKKTDRWRYVDDDLFTLRDRHEKVFVLGPTHEEAVADLVAGLGTLSVKQLPLLLYQISRKWRDEIKPRLGLLRGREFVMKDLYSFDSNLENALETYRSVRRAYENILGRVGLEYIVAVGDTGMMGGTSSHEYHYSSDIGEDTVLSCRSCDFHVNADARQENVCAECRGPLSSRKAVEIGHTFLLGTKYSEPLCAVFSDRGTPKPMTMGCYGLGLTRLIAAASETLSLDQELRWPRHLSPYTVCLVPPKEKSRTAEADRYTETIWQILEKANVDTIIDDRVDLTIGRRIIDARRTGYPYLVIIGKRSVESTPYFEIHDVNDSKQLDLTLEGMRDFFEENDAARREGAGNRTGSDNLQRRPSANFNIQ